MRLELLRRGLGAQRRSALIWGAALLLLVVSVLASWPAMTDAGALDDLLGNLPAELIAALGLENLGTPVGFLNGNLYAMLLPLLLAVLGVLHTNALTAGDEDAGRLELLLALPVSRTGVYLSRFIAVVLVLTAISALVGLTVGLGAPAFGMELDAVGVTAATASVLLLAVLHAALALALAGLGLRAGAVLAGSLGVLVLGYVVYALLPMVGSLEWLTEASPWHWALAGQPLEQGFDLPGGALLIGGSIVLVIISLVAVRRRTIRTA